MEFHKNIDFRDFCDFLTFGAPGLARGGPNGAPLGAPPGSPEIQIGAKTLTASDKRRGGILRLYTKRGPQAGPGRGPVFRQVAFSVFRELH